MPLVYIIRHALRAPNTKDIEKKDLPLSEEGIKQALHEIGPILRDDIEDSYLASGKTPLVHIHCSPHLRAVQTAEHMRHSLEKLHQPLRYYIAEELRDRDAGLFYGHSKQEREQHFPVQSHLYKLMKENGELWPHAKAPGETAENFYDVEKRVKQFHHMLSATPAAAGEEMVHVFVTHNYTANVAAMQLMGENKHWFAHAPKPKCGSIRKLQGEQLCHMQNQGFIYEGRNAHHTEREGHKGPSR